MTTSQVGATKAKTQRMLGRWRARWGVAAAASAAALLMLAWRRVAQAHELMSTLPNPEHQKGLVASPTTTHEPIMISLVRRSLTRVGARVTPAQMYWVERAMSQLKVGHWFRQNGFRFMPLYRCRQQLYAALARDFAGERVLYLEFGVYQGASLRAWSELLDNPHAQLHGFDSFQGLPETWNVFNPRGAYDTDGTIAHLEDPRVRLHVGWFHETLPHFVVPPHDRLLVHLDADLYSSTRYVLETLKDAMRPGTLLLFDEFYDHMHELRAFDEFLASSGMRFRFVGGATNLSQCAFERIA